MKESANHQRSSNIDANKMNDLKATARGKFANSRVWIIGAFVTFAITGASKAIAQQAESAPSHKQHNFDAHDGFVFTTLLNHTPRVEITQGGTFLVYGRSGKNLTSVNENILNKYSAIIEEGVLSEDFAMAPVASWADFVFDNDYQLPSLTEVAAFVKEHKHLPNIPTQAEIAANGYSMHEMNIKLLEKIEQLTLYAIEQQSKIDALQQALANEQESTTQARLILLEGQIAVLQRVLADKK